MVNNWEKKTHGEKSSKKAPHIAKHIFSSFFREGRTPKLALPPSAGANSNEKNGAKKPSHGEKEAKRQQKGVHANSGFCLRGTIAYYCPPPFESYNFLNFLRGGGGD